MGGAMADIDYMHSVNIMRAALTYFDRRTRRIADLMTKILDLIYCFRYFRQPLDEDEYDSGNYKMDVEGLLTEIRPHCNDRERPIIDQILGIFNAKRMYEAYTTYMNMMKTMQEFNNADPEHPSENGSFDFDLSSILGNNSFGNFSASDIQNLVKTFQAFNHNPSSGSGEHEEQENHTIDNTSSLVSAAVVNPDAKEADEASNANDYDNGEAYPNHSDSVIEVDFSTGAKTGGKSPSSTFDSNSPNPNEDFASDLKPEEDQDTDKSDSSNVLDMLKTMVPPEQISTFENLSMLFKAMSYDNTNKPNQK
jgi:hypothetical protein